MDTGPSPKAGFQYEHNAAPIENAIPPASNPPGYPPRLPTYPSMSGAISSPGPPPPPTDTIQNTGGYPESSFGRLPVRIHTPQNVSQDIRSAKAAVEVGLGGLMRLQLERLENNKADVAERLRSETVNVLGDLKALRDEVSDIARAAESHRWRKWLVGGVV